MASPSEPLTVCSLPPLGYARRPHRAMDGVGTHAPHDAQPCRPLRQRASGVTRPWPGGEKRTAGRASPHEELCSDGVVAPPVCDHQVVPDRGMVCDRCNPSGSAVDACRGATARARRAERAAHSEQTLQSSRQNRRPSQQSDRSLLSRGSIPFRLKFSRCC